LELELVKMYWLQPSTDNILTLLLPCEAVSSLMCSESQRHVLPHGVGITLCNFGSDTLRIWTKRGVQVVRVLPFL
jgi:hypothetical protein